MVAYTSGADVKKILPLVTGLTAGLGVAAGTGLMPLSVLEPLVMDSGLPAILPAAAPPLGVTARLLVALASGGVTAIFLWMFLSLLLGGTRARSVRVRPVEAPRLEETPALRRSDAHPDAPARAPVRAARDLGTPFLEVKAPRAEGEEAESEPLILSNAQEWRNELRPEPVPAMGRCAPDAGAFDTAIPISTAEMPSASGAAPFVAAAERDLPADLNEPLSAFDPDAIPEQPIAFDPKVVPLRRRDWPRFDPGERIDTFALRPADSAQGAQGDSSVGALLERLERGVANRRGSGLRDTQSRGARTGGDGNLESALASLRNLATQAS